MVGERRMRGEESVRLEEEGVFLHLHFIFRETNIRIYLYIFFFLLIINLDTEIRN